MQCDLKDLDDKGIVTFYFSAFGNKDSDGDIVTKGAFAKTIKENFKRIKHHKNHDPRMIIGVPQEIQEDDFGAWMRSKLILNTTNGKDTYEEYKAGAITEHSFKYDIIKYDIKNADSEEERERYLNELKLWEASSLTSWGANEMTRLINIKSLSIEDAVIYLNKLMKLQKGDFKDEYFKQLELKIIEVDNHIKSLIEPPGNTLNEPPGNTDEPVSAIRYFRNNLTILNNG